MRGAYFCQPPPSCIFASDTPITSTPSRSKYARSSSTVQFHCDSIDRHTRGCVLIVTLRSAQARGAADAAPAVELKIDAREELGLATREVHRSERRVARVAQARQMHRLDLRAPLRRHVGVTSHVHDEARAQCVAPNVVLRVLDGEAPRERVECALA